MCDRGACDLSPPPPNPLLQAAGGGCKGGTPDLGVMGERYWHAPAHVRVHMHVKVNNRAVFILRGFQEDFGFLNAGSISSLHLLVTCSTFFKNRLFTLKFGLSIRLFFQP